MRVFVTDGDSRAALAVTRSLGRAGHTVFVGEKFSPCLSHESRFCTTRIVYSDPATASEEFIEEMSSLVAKHDIEVLLPIADIATLLVSGNRDRFPTCKIPFASPAKIARAADKVDMVKTAMQLGIPVPSSTILMSPDDVIDPALQFPVVVKPARSRVQTASGWMSSGVSYAANRETLERDIAGRRPHDFPALLQERIVGAGVGIFACFDRGRPIALFGHRRIRERPPWGGVSVLSESVAMDPIATDNALRLLEHLGWHGVAMVEFKEDSRGGAPKLMEINGRFWGSLQLAIDAGVDFPAMLVNLGADSDSRPASTAPTPAPYKVGVRSRWFWGDVDALLLDLFARNGEASAGRPSRWHTVLDFAKLWGRDLYYENPRRDDPGPWLFETRQWFSRATKRKRSTPAGAQPARVPTPFRTSVATSLDDVGLDECQWNQLASTSNTNSVFQTHQWIRSWSNVFGGDIEPMFVTARNRDTIVGLAALMIERSAIGGRTLRFIGDRRADYCDILTRDGRPDVAEALFESVIAGDSWDSIELNRIPAQSPSIEAMRSVCRRAGLRMLVEDEFACPTLLVAGREDEVRAIYDRPSVRRPQKYFERQGKLVIRDLTTWQAIAPHLDAFFQQHIDRWHNTDSASLFHDAQISRFYRELAENVANAGWMLFSIAELDGQPIAYHYGFDYNGALIWYKPSFDATHRQHSPGLVMVRHLIGFVLSHQRRELDFTLGDEAFKRRFTNHARKTVRVRVFHSRFAYETERARRAIVSKVKQLSPA